MPIEIERKFLVSNDHWRKLADAGTAYIQGYLCRPGRASVRVRIEGQLAFVNIKSASLDIKRLEYEYPVPVSEARELLDNLCEKPLIEKTRYKLQHQGLTWEIDCFKNDNQGLIVAEVELESVDQVFDRPDWLGEEVSSDPRYYNVNLVRHPFKDWTTSG